MAASPLASLRLPRGPFLAALTLAAFVGLLFMGYFILEPFRAHAADGPPPTSIADVDKAKLLLQQGNPQEQKVALMQLVGAGAEKPLAECLADADPAVVQLAVAGLWECWLNEAGNEAREIMEAGVLAMNDGELEQASRIFQKLMLSYPHWAEAINKQATVLYMQGHVQESIALCRQVVALKPDHFGAWNGLALCAIQVEDWPLALMAVQQSLRLQPKSPANLQLLKLVQSRLTQV